MCVNEATTNMLGFSAIFDDTKGEVREPIVQCVQIKPLPPQANNQERYRAVFSDIANYVQTMLATRTFCWDLLIALYHVDPNSRSKSRGDRWFPTKGLLCPT